MLLRFSELIQVIDAKGRAIRLSQTHRFRHTRLTRLAELGLPVHVLQRYAGHANPTMSMHYVAQREEHAEQAFLATRKFKADGGIVKLFENDCGAVDVSLFGGQIYWLTRSFMPLRWQ